MHKVKFLGFVLFLVFSIVFTGCKKKEGEKVTAGKI
jgi:hypothetical protein